MNTTQTDPMTSRKARDLGRYLDRIVARLPHGVVLVGEPLRLFGLCQQAATSSAAERQAAEEWDRLVDLSGGEVLHLVNTVELGR